MTEKTTGDSVNTPPWGSAEDFNPEKAWSLIQNLRSDLDSAKAARASASTEAEAKAAELEKVRAEHDEFVKSAEASIAERAAEVEKINTLRSKELMLADAGLPRDYVDMVHGDSEDDIKTSVQRLSALRGTGETQDRRPDPAQVAEPVVDRREEAARQFFGA